MSPNITLCNIFDIALPSIRMGIIDYIFCCSRHFRLVACVLNCVPLALNFPLENHSSFFCQYMLFLADIRWSVGYFYLIETIVIEFSTHISYRKRNIFGLNTFAVTCLCSINSLQRPSAQHCQCAIRTHCHININGRKVSFQ